MNGFDDRDVDEAFLAGGFRLAPRAHALREVDELGRELIALRELFPALLFADGELVSQAFRILERGLADDAAFRADYLITRAVRGAEAADDVRGAIAGELHDDVHGFRHLGEARIAGVRGRRPHLSRLRREHIARGIDAIDADVPLGAAAELAVEADVSGLDLHRELRIEPARIAYLPAPHDIGDLEIRALEVQAIRRHELHAVLLAGFDHAPALARARRERLLAEHVQSRARRAHGPGAVQGIRQRDVDGVDVAAREQLACLLVGMEPRDAVALAQRIQLLAIVGHERGELRVAPGVLEGGEHGRLGDVAKADHGEPQRFVAG
jgi:hypothetical protein